jgi:hypothetical protein
MVTALLGVLLAAPSAGPAPKGVAMVLSAAGPVTVRRDKEETRLGPGHLVAAGDRLRTGDGATALLLFLGDGHRERLTAGKTVVVQAKGCDPPGERVAGPRLTPGQLQGLQELGRSGRGAVGVPRGDPSSKPQPVYPLFGARVLSGRPELTWAAADGADSYLVEMFNGAEGEDKELLWTATTKQTRLGYPAGQKALEGGFLYRWRVTPTRAGRKGKATVLSEFFVMTSTDRKRLEGVDELVKGGAAADLLLAAALYEAHGAYGEALRTYERLAKLLPREPRVQLALANYYERAGLPERAATARRLAKQLGSDAPPK